MTTQNDHSFAVCAYGESDFLETCIRSLQEQECPSTIFISTSTDNDHIRGVAERLNVPVYVHDGHGIAADWNAAFEKADTPYLTLAHQDDVYDKTYGRAVRQAFKKDTNAAIAFTDYHEIRQDAVVPDNTNLKIKKLLLSPLKISGRNAWLRGLSLSFGNAICCPAVSYNKEVLKDFRFDEAWTNNLDWKAWADMSEAGYSFIYIPKALMMHRIHAGSETTNAIQDNRRTREDLDMFARFWPKPVAKIIGKFYARSENSNNMDDETTPGA